MREKVEAALEPVRAMLATHGGGVELHNVDEATGRVQVVLQGHCAGCPGARMTMANVVEAQLKKAVPEVTGVEAVSGQPACGCGE